MKQKAFINFKELPLEQIKQPFLEGERSTLENSSELHNC